LSGPCCIFRVAGVEFAFCSAQQTTAPSILFGSLPHFRKRSRKLGASRRALVRALAEYANGASVMLLCAESKLTL
ncbi:MAG: hypothetical protein M0Z55_04755, partial [Peptococcaceae bacterium]|nr:hypothetical protein [Peptococcaceae bacterium]